MSQNGDGKRDRLWHLEQRVASLEADSERLIETNKRLADVIMTVLPRNIEKVAADLQSNDTNQTLLIRMIELVLREKGIAGDEDFQRFFEQVIKDHEKDSEEAIKAALKAEGKDPNQPMVVDKDDKGITH